MGASPNESGSYPVGRRKSEALGEDWEERLAEARARRQVALAARESVGEPLPRDRERPWEDEAHDTTPDLLDETTVNFARKRGGPRDASLPDYVRDPGEPTLPAGRGAEPERAEDRDWASTGTAIVLRPEGARDEAEGAPVGWRKIAALVLLVVVPIAGYAVLSIESGLKVRVIDSAGGVARVPGHAVPREPRGEAPAAVEATETAETLPEAAPVAAEAPAVPDAGAAEVAAGRDALPNGATPVGPLAEAPVETAAPTPVETAAPLPRAVEEAAPAGADLPALARVAPRARPAGVPAPVVAEGPGPAAVAAAPAFAGTEAPVAEQAPALVALAPGLVPEARTAPTRPALASEDLALAVMPGGFAQSVKSTLGGPAGAEAARAEGMALPSLPDAEPGFEPVAAHSVIAVPTSERPAVAQLSPAPTGQVDVAFALPDIPSAVPAEAAPRIAMLEGSWPVSDAVPALTWPLAVTAGAAPADGTTEPPAAPEAGPAVVGSAVVYIHAPVTVGGDAVARAADRVAEATGLAVSVREPVTFKVSATNVRYFHEADRAAAADVAERLSARLRDFTSFEPAPDPGTIEVWLAGEPAAVQPVASAAPVRIVTPRPAAPQPAAVRPAPVRAAPAPVFETTTITRTRRSGLGRLFGN